MKKWRNLTALAAGVALLAGCTTNPYTGERQASKAGMYGGIGAVAGAAVGAATASKKDRAKGALIGAAVGGAAGGGYGYYVDRQEAKLRQTLQGTGVQVQRDGNNLTLIMPGNITFAFDSSSLQPQFLPVLDNVARTLTEYNQTVIEVAGHTDSVGTDAYNQQLSLQRANAVASYLQGRGVMQQRMIVTGAGESRPIASNDTEAGRAQNRRVEITIVPVQG